MKPKIFVLVFMLFSICGCSNLLNFDNENRINLEFDIHKMTSYKNDSSLSYNVNNYHVEATLYMVNKTSINNPLEKTNLSLIETCTSKIDKNGKAYITFKNVSIGMQVVVIVNIYETSSVGEKKISYSGNSNIFRVKKSGNNIQIVLKPIQNLQTHTVTFNLSGGHFENGSPLNVQVEHGKSVSAPTEIPVLDGYIFDYWYIMNDDGSFQKYDFSKPITSNLIIYAKWEIYLTATSVIPYIASLTTEGPHDVVIRGEISNDDISNIKNAMVNNTNAFINLDLSKTTGLTSLNNSFAKCLQLTGIILPEGLVSIGNSVFQSCNNLTNVHLPESLQSIESGVFASCRNLSSIYLPSNLSKIVDTAFIYCNKLINFEVSESNQYFSASSDKKMLLSYDKTSLYCYPSATGSITLPEGIITIWGKAFYDVTIEEVIIPTSVKHIKKYAFQWCENLKEIVIPEGIETIEDYAFQNCTGLQKVEILSYIPGKDVFCGCSDFELILKNGITIIDANAFSRYPMKSIVIPEGVTSIGESAFSNCENLVNVTITEGVTSIGESAFSNCENLVNVTISDSVTNIGASAFSGCKNISNITIPESVTTIGDSVFSNCENLETINIPNTIYVLSDSLFSSCYKLNNITLPSNLTTIEDYVFSDCTSLEEIEIPGSVTSIGIGAFSGTNIEAIKLPNTLTTIGDSLFSNCEKLSEITIPDNVTSIGDSAFAYCYNLSEITIPDNVTSIGNSAFEYCTKLNAISIPNYVTFIGACAFRCCIIPEITVPLSVSKIGGYAFDMTTLIALTFEYKAEWYSSHYDFSPETMYKFYDGFTDDPSENARIYIENVHNYFSKTKE